MTQRDARLSGALPPLLIVCGLCVYLCVFATCIQNISQQTEIEKSNHVCESLHWWNRLSNGLPKSHLLPCEQF